MALGSVRLDVVVATGTIGWPGGPGTGWPGPAVRQNDPGGREANKRERRLGQTTHSFDSDIHMHQTTTSGGQPTPAVHDEEPLTSLAPPILVLNGPRSACAAALLARAAEAVDASDGLGGEAAARAAPAIIFARADAADELLAAHAVLRRGVHAERVLLKLVEPGESPRAAQAFLSSLHLVPRWAHPVFVGVWDPVAVAHGEGVGGSKAGSAWLPLCARLLALTEEAARFLRVAAGELAEKEAAARSDARAPDAAGPEASVVACAPAPPAACLAAEPTTGGRRDGEAATGLPSLGLPELCWAMPAAVRAEEAGERQVGAPHVSAVARARLETWCRGADARARTVAGCFGVGARARRPAPVPKPAPMPDTAGACWWVDSGTETAGDLCLAAMLWRAGALTMRVSDTGEGPGEDTGEESMGK